MYSVKISTKCCLCLFMLWSLLLRPSTQLNFVLGWHEQWIDVFKTVEFCLINLSNDTPETKLKIIQFQFWSFWTKQKPRKREQDIRKVIEINYWSSGVSCTGSSVNSGGKLAKSRSDSNLGLYGGGICFCSSCKQRHTRYKSPNDRRMLQTH